MGKKNTIKKYILGVDGGGTKTRAGVADFEGNVLATAAAGPGNFQSIGTAAAQGEIARAIKIALAAANVDCHQIASTAYGLSGADREKDFDIVAGFLMDINPSPHFVLSNDTTLILRAGTTDGVGVASVAGTGSNTMGFNEKGDHVKVGGYGPYSGDSGGSYDLSSKAIIAAWKGMDGRGPKTMIEDMLCVALGLDDLADIIEFTYFDSFNPDIHLNEYTPMIFDAAKKGDKVAVRILRQTGKECADDILSCMRRLFKDKTRAVPIVLGGSIYQKGVSPALVDAVKQKVRKIYPKVKLVRLKSEPCVGAMLLAMDDHLGKPTPAAVRRRIIKTFAHAMDCK
jgi:N-acetylglucosamine kinase-like BadF-type ATPase